MTEYTPRRYLVVGPSWVGDMVMAQSLFAALAPKSDRHIDVLAPDWSRPLLERMPEVDKALSLPFGHGELKLGERRRIGKSLADQYDQAIILPNSLKSALLPWWANIPVRTGWLGELRYGLLNDARKLDKSRYPLMVQRFVALARSPAAPVPTLDDISFPRLRASETGATAALARFNLTLDKPVLGLCPGAEFGPAKRWPDRHYAALADEWLAKGWQVWIFGSTKDAEVAERIRAQVTPGHQSQVHLLAGATSLGEAIDLMAKSSAVVSNDSGLMHIAAALDRPLVAVYGSTSPGFTPPLSNKAECVSLNLTCSPCFERECPLGHLNCLEKLPALRVSQALARVLEKAV